VSNDDNAEEREFYVTTYCNFAHSLADGEAMGEEGDEEWHECDWLSPTKLRIERDFGANAVEGSMREFYPGEMDALENDDEAALERIYQRHAPGPKCWYCDGTGAVTVVEGIDASHGNLNQEPCPVCDGEPAKHGFMMPYVPFEGVWYLARWYEHNEGHHVLLARSHRQLREMVAALVAKEPWAEVKEVWVVELLAPSRKLQRAYAASTGAAIETYFWQWVAGHCHDLHDKGKDLPRPLVMCTEYKGRDPDDAHEWDTRHSYCANCVNGVRVDGRDATEWYRERRNDFLKVVGAEQEEQRRRYPPRTVRVPSRARVAGDDEKLWYVSECFGHHSDGTRFEEFDPSEASHVEHAANHAPLLWFRKLNPVSTGEFDQMFRARQQAIRDEREAERKVQEAADEREARHRLKRFLAVVGAL
jgi:hypothetical protein